jgi:phage N-6-adenine-methyltransferase
MNVHFSSATEMWETPQDFFNSWSDKVGGFDLDVCASLENAKCPVFFDKQTDGLKQEWFGKCWMNPPYGREIGKWMHKAYMENKKGVTVVCLIPSRTDTRWWHDYAVHGEIVFIKGRLKFGKSKNSAPFPSAVVVFA